MTTTVALICIVILGSGADKNSNICPYVGAAWGHIYLLALCSRNAWRNCHVNNEKLHYKESEISVNSFEERYDKNKKNHIDTIAKLTFEGKTITIHIYNSTPQTAQNRID